MYLCIHTQRTEKTTTLYLVDNDSLQTICEINNLESPDEECLEPGQTIECCQENELGDTMIITPHPVITDPCPEETQGFINRWSVLEVRKLLDRVTDSPVPGLQFEVLTDYLVRGQFHVGLIIS